MRIITFNNEKGGVGKTTGAQTLGAGLAIKGYRVLLGDGDQQGTLSESFGYETLPGFYELMMRDKTRYQDVIYDIDPARYAPPGVKVEGKLSMLPGNNESRALDNLRDTYRLMRRMNPLSELYDVVIFDTSPLGTNLNTMILTGSDDVIIPSQLEAWSLNGVRATLDALKQANQNRRADGLPDIRVLGILPTMTQTGTTEHATNLGKLNTPPTPEEYDRARIEERLEELPNLYTVWRPIPRRIVWGESASARLSIFAYANEHPAAEDGWRLVDEVLEAL